MLDLCDFHSHILPNADHGSSSVSESLAQLRLAMKYGVTRIFATPHFYPHRDSVSSFLRRRLSSYNQLIEAKPEGYPEIVLGAEVLLCPNIDRLPDLDKLCINGTKTILLELPFNDFGNEYVYAVEGISALGYDIVLAHAECYQREHVEDILSISPKIRVQVNASALVPFFKNRTIEDWKRRKKVVAVGSDIHGEDAKAYKMFDIAKKKLGEYLPFVVSSCDKIWDSAIII